MILFSCPTKQACKTLWKSCVEHHTFFRYTHAHAHTHTHTHMCTHAHWTRGYTYIALPIEHVLLFYKQCLCVHHTCCSMLLLRTVRTDSIKRPATTSLFRRGSTFRFSGRTQFKLLQEGTQTRRSSRRFERISSRNRSGRRTM